MVRSRLRIHVACLLAVALGLLASEVIVVILQLWLLTATMNAWLGGDESIVWPGLAVSAGGLAVNVGLFAYLRRIERTRGSGI
jgi:divalent metal cation (Fe/Co/Zn/Cd) transporter